MTFRFEGGQELAAALQSLPDRVSARIVREVLTDVAEPMRASIARKAPTGDEAPHIKDNIAISPARTKDAAGVAIGPTTGYYYGFMQEFGSVHHGAQPFMRPAFDAEAPKAVPEIGRRLWVELAGRGVGRSRTTTGGLDDFGTGGTSGLGAGNQQSTPRGRR